jgi:uncharacterized protein involved in propanediol utilization
MFIVALFTTVNLWNQPRCSITNEWIKEMCVYVHHAVLFSQKENKIMSFAGKWMELEIIMLSEISQVQTVKYHIFAQMWNLDLK